MTNDTKAVARFNFDAYHGCEFEADDGYCVLFTDHERVVRDVWEITREIQIQSDKYWNELRQLRATLEDLNEAQAVGDGTVSGSLLHWHQRALAAEAALAASRDEVEGLRKVVYEITDCLDDTVHERGGWATEEIICMGRDAAMEKGNV